MAKLVRNINKGLKAVEDFELVKILKSEISFELSSNPFQGAETGSLGEFVVDYDSPRSKDVVLRRKLDSGEEVAVSAQLGPPKYDEELVFPRNAFVKVCVKKPSLSSILHFDCEVYQDSDKGSEFSIDGAYYLRSPMSLSPSLYKGPFFRHATANIKLCRISMHGHHAMTS
ncbi:hypothetical protein PIB30_026166 [Stylosanthes scabra]|uniref:Uncharacterized protein n=1 Tax=Stylosanthes scabra TaxID=79078 RepID=A0ABU6W8T6_9FABA|nr:hypothetical protein [Stylosanthes scabra]